MGDRCYVSFRVHKDDVDKAIAHGFEPDEEGRCEVEEANYGLTQKREQLAAAGVRFYGYHSAGGEYPAFVYYAVDGVQCEHVGDGDGMSIGFNRLTVDAPVPQLDADAIAKANEYLKAEAAVIALVEESWT